MLGVGQSERAANAPLTGRALLAARVKAAREGLPPVWLDAVEETN